MGVRLVLRPLLALVNLQRRLAPPRADRSVAERRRAAAGGPMQMRWVTARSRRPVLTTEHPVPVDGGHISVRRYRPADATGALPTHLFLHGGSFWLGDAAASDPICCWYAAEADCQVVSVDYRLAPEHPFPTSAEDGYAALLWLAARADELEVDLDRLSVGGISAGGGLAVAVALMARDRGGPAIRFLALEIPVLDLTLSSPSTHEFAEDHLLTRPSLVEAVSFYLSDPEQVHHPYASPLLADDLTGLPPTSVITCECDPLRDDGEGFVERLRASGVPVRSYRAAGHVHGSTYCTRFLPSARRAVAVTTSALREALHAPGPPTDVEASGSVQSMFPAKKDDQEHDPAKAMGEPGDGGGEVSQGPNSFGNAETSTGGADSVNGTPDATPSVALGDRDVPEAPAAS